jgi:hypothetical protein
MGDDAGEPRRGGGLGGIGPGDPGGAGPGHPDGAGPGDPGTGPGDPGGTGIDLTVHADVEREGERAVSRHGLAGTDPVCVQALELFCSVLGAVAGDLALITLARSGLYIAGGIAPAILPALQRGHFLDAFHDKGRMARVVVRVPVYVVTNGRVGLYGAATAAAEDMPRR